MLVLTRGLLETVMVGDDIEVTVLEVRGDKVKLGFAAPDSIDVHRKEIWLRIQEEKAKSWVTINQSR